MARVSKVDECMFCGNAPCTCRAIKKAAAKPRKVSPIVEATPIVSSRRAPAQKADVAAAMRAASQIKHQGSTIKEDHDATDETALILADPEMVAAIQALASMMHPSEHKRFAQVLAVPVDPKARAAAWRRKFVT